MDNLREKFLKGEKLGIELYDIHAHIGGYNRDYPVFDGETEKIVREMDRIGVKKAFVMPLGIYGTEWFYQNDKLIYDCKKFPDRFIGFSLVNLNYIEKEIEKELDRCRKEGIKGMKLIASYQDYPAEGKRIEFVCEYANHYKMPILNHGWSTISFLEKMVKKYKNVIYIVGHGNIYWKEIVNKYDNIYLSTCSYLWYGDVKKMVKEIRIDRLCWGSDFSDLHLGFTLGPICLSKLDDAVKRKILGENMKELLSFL